MKNLKIQSLLLVLLFAGRSFAGFDISIETGQVFAAGSGIQTLDVLVSGDASDPALENFTAGFVLSGGSFTSPSVGTVGGAGMVGEGNLLSSSFTRPVTTAGVLDLEFDAPLSIPTTASVIATINIDTGSFLPGVVYTITPGALSGSSTPQFSSATAGSFEISAVPEPTSGLVLGCIGIAGVMVRRRRTA